MPLDEQLKDLEKGQEIEVTGTDGKTYYVVPDEYAEFENRYAVLDENHKRTYTDIDRDVIMADYSIPEPAVPVVDIPTPGEDKGGTKKEYNSNSSDTSEPTSSADGGSDGRHYPSRESAVQKVMTSGKSREEAETLVDEQIGKGNIVVEDNTKSTNSEGSDSLPSHNVGGKPTISQEKDPRTEIQKATAEALEKSKIESSSNSSDTSEPTSSADGGSDGRHYPSRESAIQKVMTSGKSREEAETLVDEQISKGNIVVEDNTKPTSSADGGSDGRHYTSREVAVQKVMTSGMTRGEAEALVDEQISKGNIIVEDNTRPTSSADGGSDGRHYTSREVAIQKVMTSGMTREEAEALVDEEISKGNIIVEDDSSASSVERDSATAPEAARREQRDLKAATEPLPTSTDDGEGYVLSQEDLQQLEDDAEAYAAENNVDIEEARAKCKKKIEELRSAEQKTNDEDILETKLKTKVTKCIEKKEYLDDNLKSVRDVLKGNNKANAEKLKDSLTNMVLNNPFLNTELSNYQGESSQEYKLYIEELKERFNVVIENANTSVEASRIVDEELIPTLEALAENDIKREELRVQLEEKQSEYKSFLATKPEKRIQKTYTDKSVDPPKEKTKWVTNEKYVEWLEQKQVLETALTELITQVEECDTLGQELQDKCYLILGKEVDLEELLKPFKRNDPGKSGKRSGGGGRSSGGSGEQTALLGGAYEGITTEPPVTGEQETTPEESTTPEEGSGSGSELPDNSKEQLDLYKELSSDQLAEIEKNLSSFASENEMTLDELLYNDEYAPKVIDSLLNSSVISENLKTLIKEGNQIQSRNMVRDILEGKQNTTIGVSAIADESLKQYFQGVAENNNLTLDALLTDSENFGIVKSAVIDYADIAGIFNNQTDASIKESVLKYYDGNEVTGVSNGTIDAVRIFTDLSAKSENKPVEDYVESTSLLDNFRSLSKNSVTLNTIKDYSSDKLIETLKTLIQ
jgi:uncharacterized protein YoaH (UPF0181 family)